MCRARGWEATKNGRDGNAKRAQGRRPYTAATRTKGTRTRGKGGQGRPRRRHEEGEEGRPRTAATGTREGDEGRPKTAATGTRAKGKEGRPNMAATRTKGTRGRCCDDIATYGTGRGGKGRQPKMAATGTKKGTEGVSYWKPMGVRSLGRLSRDLMSSCLQNSSMAGKVGFWPERMKSMAHLRAMFSI